MEDRISISLSEKGQNDISSVRVDGVIDTITAGELEKVIDSLVKRGRFKIVLDLAGVEYVSSAGWGIFISKIKEVRASGGDIKLAAMTENVHEIYELLEFENVLMAYATADEARLGFGAPPTDGRSKKKLRGAQTVTVIDPTVISDKNSSRRSHKSVPDRNGDNHLVPRILEFIKDDPFASVGEIRDDINKNVQSIRIGWWEVFRALKGQKLLLRRSRFRYARRFYRQ